MGVSSMTEAGLSSSDSSLLTNVLREAIFTGPDSASNFRFDLENPLTGVVPVVVKTNSEDENS